MAVNKETRSAYDNKKAKVYDENGLFRQEEAAKSRALCNKCLPEGGTEYKLPYRNLDGLLRADDIDVHPGIFRHRIGNP